MAYNEQLVDRIREALAGREDLTEKKMFGGLSFMLDGHMYCGVVEDDLMVQVGPYNHGKTLSEPHAKPMDFTCRPLKEMVYVGPEGYRTDESLSN